MFTFESKNGDPGVGGRVETDYAIRKVKRIHPFNQEKANCIFLINVHAALGFKLTESS